MEAETTMTTARCQELLDKSNHSYYVNIDLRELRFLCTAAEQLRMLSDAVRLLAKRVTMLDEGQRFVDLLDGLVLLEGGLVE